MKISLFCLIAFLLLSSAKSCTKDTCNKEDTFSQVSLGGGAPEVKGDSVGVGLVFTLKTVLPDGYFEAAVVNQGKEDRFGNAWDNDFQALAGFKMLASGGKLWLKKGMLEEGANQMTFHFVLPDRRDFMDCEHPGSGDTYFLDLGFKLTKTQDAFSTSDFTWKEQLRKGPF